MTPPDGYRWAAVFTDGFDTLDTATWYRYHSTYGTGVGAQDYLLPSNITVDGSTVTVTSRRQDYTGPQGSRQFTSGFLSTGKRGTVADPSPSSDTFFPRACYIEARLRIPQCHGILPAFWLRHRAGAGVAEVDVMEVFDDQIPDHCCHTLHLNGVTNLYQAHGYLQDNATAPQWHTIGVAIHPDTGGIRFRFYVDDTQTGDYLATDTAFWDDYPDVDLWDVSLNIHTGADWVGSPDDPLGYSSALDRCLSAGTPPNCDATGLVAPSFPVTYDADYVRVYSLEGAPVSIVREHHFTGTVGEAVAGEGFDSHIGEDFYYVEGGVSGGVSASCPGTGYGYLRDLLDAGYTRIYIQIPALPSATATFLTTQSSAGTKAAVHVRSTGELGLVDGHTYSTTTTTMLTPGAWYRVEWHVEGAGQELRLYSPPNVATPVETITAGITDTAAVSEWRVGQGSASNSPVYVDEMALGSDWIGSATPPAQAVTATLTLSATAAIPGTSQQVTATLTLDATASIPTPPAGDLPNRPGPIRLSYDVTVYETVTGRIVTSLPYTKLGWNTPLNTAGTCSATIPLTAPELSGVNVRALTTPWRFSLLISAGERVLWFGPITPGRSYDGDGTITLPASELWAILKGRLMIGNPATVGKNGELPTDLTVTDKTLAGLAVRVVQFALTVPGGKLPVQMPAPEDGDAHTRTYAGDQITTAADALTKLTQAEDGPDIRFDGTFLDDRRRATYVMRVG
ncbi:MAG: glycoside hydrolase family 16 protein [Streptosporangiales bacterium]